MNKETPKCKNCVNYPDCYRKLMKEEVCAYYVRKVKNGKTKKG